jgi:hypothetical protein
MRGIVTRAANVKLGADHASSPILAVFTMASAKGERWFSRKAVQNRDVPRESRRPVLNG